VAAASSQPAYLCTRSDVLLTLSKFVSLPLSLSRVRHANDFRSLHSNAAELRNSSNASVLPTSASRRTSTSIVLSYVLSLPLGLVTSVVSLVSLLVILREANLGDRVSQPRRKENNSARRRGPFRTRASAGSPPVLRGVHCAVNFVHADVIHADVLTPNEGSTSAAKILFCAAR
jgi:hypothetical protein